MATKTCTVSFTGPSGVCHSDLHVRDGEWQRPGPIVMGHEGAGVIEAVGAASRTRRPARSRSHSAYTLAVDSPTSLSANTQ